MGGEPCHVVTSRNTLTNSNERRTISPKATSSGASPRRKPKAGHGQPSTRTTAGVTSPARGPGYTPAPPQLTKAARWAVGHPRHVPPRNARPRPKRRRLRGNAMRNNRCSLRVAHSRAADGRELLQWPHSLYWPHETDDAPALWSASGKFAVSPAAGEQL